MECPEWPCLTLTRWPAPPAPSRWRPRSGDAARAQVRSPRGRLISADAEQWMSRPAGDLRDSAPSRAASFSYDSNRRLFRYMRLSTKDCNSSSFVWEGTTAAGASWALPGGRRLRRGGGGEGRAGAACGWGAAGRPASPAPLLVVQPAFPLQCCYANQVTSPPSARRVAPD